MPPETAELKYACKIKELFIKVDEAVTIEGKVKLFEEFTAKYTSIPRIWREWIRIANVHQPPELQNENRKRLWIKSVSHFYCKAFTDDLLQMLPIPERLNRRNIQLSIDFNLQIKPKNNLIIAIKKEALSFLGAFDLIWNKLFQRQVEWGRRSVKPLLYYLEYVKKSFSLPNDKLQSYMEYFEEFSTKPIPLEIYEECQKSRALLGEIFTYLPYQEEWMLSMKKVEDDKFVIQNLERELTMNYADKRYWMVFIEFLKERCHWKWLLNAYSRYCRLFIEDLEIRKQYQSEIKNIEEKDFDVTKWKIDLIKIERDFGSPECAMKLMKDYFGEDITEKTMDAEIKLLEPKEDNSRIPDYAIDENGLSLNRSAKSAPFQQLTETQALSLPSNLIYFILKNAKPQILHKLHSTSKQLYSITEIPICHRLEISDFKATVSFKQSLFISINDIQIGNSAKKLYLTNSLSINSNNKNRNLLTEFIPKICKCSVRFLTLRQLDVKTDDFDFLVKNVKKFECLDSRIIDSKKQSLSVTEVIDRLPNASHITFITYGIAAFENVKERTSFKERSTKIENLHIRVIQEVKDPLKICSFIWKNAAPKSRFYIELKTSQAYVDHLEDLIKIEFNRWIPADEKPSIIIRNKISFYHA